MFIGTSDVTKEDVFNELKESMNFNFLLLNFGLIKKKKILIITLSFLLFFFFSLK